MPEESLFNAYLKAWRTDKRRLVDLLRRECNPDATAAPEVIAYLEDENKVIDEMFSSSNSYVLDGDALENWRSKKTGEKTRKSVDICLFQQKEDDPITLIECKYRKIWPQKQSKVAAKVIELSEEVCGKIKGTKMFLEAEAREFRQRAFLVMNSKVASVVRSNIDFYANEGRVSREFDVVDSEELHSKLLALSIDGIN